MNEKEGGPKEVSEFDIQVVFARSVPGTYPVSFNEKRNFASSSAFFEIPEAAPPAWFCQHLGNVNSGTTIREYGMYNFAVY